MSFFETHELRSLVLNAMVTISVLAGLAGPLMVSAKEERASVQDAVHRNQPIAFTDDFERKDGAGLGEPWVDCKSVQPNDFEPLAIFDGGVAIADAFSRPGVYDTTPPSGHPPTNDRLHPGIGCAFIETNASTFSLKVVWSGNYGVEDEATVNHVEASPLIYVTPGNARFGLGVWTTQIMGVPVLLVGYIGAPVERFEPIASGLMPSHESGVAREVELRVASRGRVTVWLDGEQIPLFRDFGDNRIDYGLNPVPVDPELLDSTLHGIAVDAHVVNPVSNITRIKSIEAFEFVEYPVD